MTATSEVLNLAADLIQQRGWGTGPASMVGANGLCIMGAINAATIGRTPGDEGYELADTCPAGQAVHAYLDTADLEMDSLWQWNDTSATDAAEVIEVLRAVAVIEAARESAPVEVSA